MADFSGLAYAKLNLDFDHDLFAKEYDEKILPYGTPICSSEVANRLTTELNKAWKMVDPLIYNNCDKFTQTGDGTTARVIHGKYKMWTQVQLLEPDLTNITDPILERFKHHISIRNETLRGELKFNIRKEFENLAVYAWIKENLPFKEIKNIHCVSLEPGTFATIHRDLKAAKSTGAISSANRLFADGFVVICLNITDGGAPLYWSLDGIDAQYPKLANDSVYIANDYFLHGVPVTTSRRRQIRVTGIPDPKLWELLNHDTKVVVEDDYQFDASYNITITKN